MGGIEGERGGFGKGLERGVRRPRQGWRRHLAGTLGSSTLLEGHTYLTNGNVEPIRFITSLTSASHLRGAAGGPGPWAPGLSTVVVGENKATGDEQKVDLMAEKYRIVRKSVLIMKRWISGSFVWVSLCRRSLNWETPAR